MSSSEMSLFIFLSKKVSVWQIIRARILTVKGSTNTEKENDWNTCIMLNVGMHSSSFILYNRYKSMWLYKCIHTHTRTF